MEKADLVRQFQKYVEGSGLHDKFRNILKNVILDQPGDVFEYAAEVFDSAPASFAIRNVPSMGDNLAKEEMVEGDGGRETEEEEGATLEKQESSEVVQATNNEVVEDVVEMVVKDMEEEEEEDLKMAETESQEEPLPSAVSRNEQENDMDKGIKEEKEEHVVSDGKKEENPDIVNVDMKKKVSMVVSSSYDKSEKKSNIKSSMRKSKSMKVRSSKEETEKIVFEKEEEVKQIESNIESAEITPPVPVVPEIFIAPPVPNKPPPKLPPSLVKSQSLSKKRKKIGGKGSAFKSLSSISKGTE